MLEKANKNSVIILIGIILITLGVVVGTYEYFLQKKNETFSKMNLKLFESEIPENINSEEEYQEKISNDDNIINEEPQEPIIPII